MVTFKKLTRGCAALAAVIMVSAPAIAAEKSISVYYQDLDLSTAKGQHRLLIRIKSAARQVCASPRAESLAEKQDLARCETGAISKAMPKAELTIAHYRDAQQLAANNIAIVGN